MPTLTEFIAGFGIREIVLVIVTVAIVLASREGWRIKKVFRRKT